MSRECNEERKFQEFSISSRNFSRLFVQLKQRKSQRREQMIKQAMRRDKNDSNYGENRKRK